MAPGAAQTSAGEQRWNQACAVLAFAATAGLALDDGGYFPDAWGWAALVLLWLAALALFLRRPLTIDRRQTLFLALLCALLGWVALSAAWSSSVPATALEVERDLIYLSATLSLLLLAGPDSSKPILAGVLSAVLLICAWSLVTEIFQGRLNAIPTYRLAGPLGYWNALGGIAAMGTVLATALFAAAQGRLARALPAACVPAFLVSIYFAFGKGAWVALAAGVLAAIALSGCRLKQLAAVATLAVPGSLALWVAARAEAISTPGDDPGRALAEGHLLAAAVPAICLAAGTLAGTGTRDAVARGLARIPSRAALAAGAVLLTVLVGAFTLAGPGRLVGDARKRFEAPNVAPTMPFKGRLVTLSGTGRSELWRVAWETFARAPIAGDGAGSFARSWLLERRDAYEAQDAHNLYLETLSELGLVGLALLLAAFAVPLASAVRARGDPAAVAAAAALVAYLVHAAAEWDWEMPAVTVAALSCAIAILVAGHRTSSPALSRTAAVSLLTGIVAAIVLAFVSVIGNGATRSSADDLARGDWSKAAMSARTAVRWAPWAAEPSQLLGEAEAARGDRRRARAELSRALQRDRGDWSIWLDLARLEDPGPRRKLLLLEAARRNPHSPAIFAEVFGREPLRGGRHNPKLRR